MIPARSASKEHVDPCWRFGLVASRAGFSRVGSLRLFLLLRLVPLLALLGALDQLLRLGDLALGVVADPLLRALGDLPGNASPHHDPFPRCKPFRGQSPQTCDPSSSC